METLRPGARGNEVRRLQLLLNSAVKATQRLRPDGIFGRVTEARVKQLQAQNGLVPDGIVGPSTWRALGQGPVLRPGRPTHPGADWLAIATAELGVHENKLAGRHNQRIVEYHASTTLRATTDEIPWCSSFINWVMAEAGYAGSQSALARSWLGWGKAIDPPRAGAITVIKRKGASQDAATGSSTGFHVGFFISKTASSIRLLGGNQADSVCYSNFMLAAYEIRGFRWPATGPAKPSAVASSTPLLPASAVSALSMIGKGAQVAMAAISGVKPSSPQR